MHPCVVDLYIYTYICSLLTDSRLDANLSRCWYRQTSGARRRSRGWFEDCTLTKAMALGAAPTCYSSATCRYVVRSTGRPSLWSSARAHSSVCQRRRCSTPSTRPSLCPTWTRARSSSTSTTPLTVCMYIYIYNLRSPKWSRQYIYIYIYSNGLVRSLWHPWNPKAHKYTYIYICV